MMFLGITEDELIKKKDIFDSLKDDDDVDWKHNPFDVDSIDEMGESSEQLMSKSQLQTKLKTLVLEFIDVIATKIRKKPEAVEEMKIVIDEKKWRLPCKHSEKKQREIRK
jgi:hypothetical protein